MTRALVVVESMFGTARAVAAAPDRVAAQLLVVGGPTPAFRDEPPRHPGRRGGAGRRRRAVGHRDPGVDGPLLDGELERARDWGRRLADRLDERVSRPVPRR
jgi:hypothetical protein